MIDDADPRRFPLSARGALYPEGNRHPRALGPEGVTQVTGSLSGYVMNSIGR